ncbi:hypothetical protein DL771_002305 [Monosporascus sp. 5C6A]|nr:hypothetical protein DL771_002305 [Monosporascus sp. 5C6A]
MEPMGDRGPSRSGTSSSHSTPLYGSDSSLANDETPPGYKTPLSSVCSEMLIDPAILPVEPMPDLDATEVVDLTSVDDTPEPRYPIAATTQTTAGDDEVLLSSLHMQEHAGELHPMGNAGGLEYDWPLDIDPKDNQIDPRLPTSAIPPRTPSQAINAVRLQCQTEIGGSTEDLGSAVAQGDESATGAELKQDNIAKLYWGRGYALLQKEVS